MNAEDLYREATEGMAQEQERTAWHRRETSERVELVSASAVKPENVRWAWTDRVPFGMLTLLVGQPGLGKSGITTEIAARMSRGQLAGDHREPAPVMIATAEDHRAAVVVPRLHAAGADLDRVLFVDVHRDGETGGPSLPGDIGLIRSAIESVGARVVVIDPVIAHVPLKFDAHKDQHIRNVLAPLAKMAEEQECAVLAVVHLNKGDTREVLNRVGMSIGFVAAARSVLLAGVDPEDESMRVLVHAKSNVGPLAPGLRYRIEGTTIEHAGEAIDTMSVVWMGEVETKPEDVLRGSDDDRSAVERAVEFLREALAEGPQSVKEVDRQARRLGIPRRTLERARSRLGIRAVADRDEKGRLVGWNLVLGGLAAWDISAGGDQSAHTANPWRSGDEEASTPPTLGGLGVVDTTSEDEPHRHTANTSSLDAEEGWTRGASLAPCLRCGQSTAARFRDQPWHPACLEREDR